MIAAFYNGTIAWLDYEGMCADRAIDEWLSGHAYLWRNRMPYTMTDDDHRRCDLLAVAAWEAFDAVKMEPYTAILRIIGSVYVRGWTPKYVYYVREIAHSLGPDTRLEPLWTALLAVTKDGPLAVPEGDDMRSADEEADWVMRPCETCGEKDGLHLRGCVYDRVGD